MTDHAPHSPFQDLDGFIALPRLGSLSLSPDGRRLVVDVTSLNADRTTYTSALWDVDVDGRRPARRITNSVDGEALAAQTDEGVLFTARREVPSAGEDTPSKTTKAIWWLPQFGEASVACSRDGGYSFVRTARTGQTVLLGVPVHAGVADDEADARKRSEREKKKVSAILHDGPGVRYWDHDIALERTRLRRARLVEGRLVDVEDVTGDVGRAIGDVALSPDGTFAACSWRVDLPLGRRRDDLVLIDVATGERRVLATEQGRSYFSPVFSDDGRRIACVEDIDATPEETFDQHVVIVDVADGTRRTAAPDWDRWASPVAFSPDGGTVYVTADEDGHCPIFAIDLACDEIRRLTDDGAHTSVRRSPDGGTLYAVRTAYDCPGEVVAVDTATGERRVLPSVEYPALPGRLERVETTASDGVRIPGWLVLPEGCSADDPAPLTLWVHGGPVSSWNCWSWRWCPWILAARGQAVLLPDPALSTGYGRAFVQRGHSRWGAEPYTDVMALTDAVEARADIRDDSSTMMGGSFGGYMANWIATHTSRFKAIVSHASLWDLRAFSGTTDWPSGWRDQFQPEIYTEHNPALFADQIATPMLVIHGDKDYRVPIGEGLALWWALTGSYAGSPEDFPHRFLYFPDENHWILTPQHARLWYETVIEFLDAHRAGRMPSRPELL